MGLRHGAKQLLEQIEAHEKEGFRLLELAAGRVKSNPVYAIEKIHEAQDQFREARKLRDERLPEMIQKAAPPIEQRIKALEEWRERVESNVIQMRKAQ